MRRHKPESTAHRRHRARRQAGRPDNTVNTITIAYEVQFAIPRFAALTLLFFSFLSYPQLSSDNGRSLQPQSVRLLSCRHTRTRSAW